MTTAVPTPTQISLAGVSVRYADRLVLDRVDLAIRPGERVGVVGDNGAGKSTLLAVLAGQVTPTAGDRRVEVPGGIAHVGQTLDLPPATTVQQTVDHLLADLRSLEAELRAAEEAMGRVPECDLPALLDRYAALTTTYEARDGHAADLRVEAGLTAFGLAGLDRERPIGTMSGGQQARLALAVALASYAELLLLDEPTNDLDAEALAWLEDRLTRHRGTVVVATHDRTFLDGLTSTIVELDRGQARRYGVGYDGYLTAKAVERERQRLAHERWRRDLERHRTLVATTAARVEAIPRKLELDGFGHGAFRARSRDHGSMGRVRRSKEQVRRLLADPVLPATRATRPRRRVHSALGSVTGGARGAGGRPPGRRSSQRVHAAPGPRRTVAGDGPERRGEEHPPARARRGAATHRRDGAGPARHRPPGTGIDPLARGDDGARRVRPRAGRLPRGPRRGAARVRTPPRRRAAPSGRDPLGRSTPPHRSRPSHRAARRPAPARRADQPPLAGPRRGARASPGRLPGHRRPGDPRPTSHSASRLTGAATSGRARHRRRPLKERVSRALA
ncbi:ATP-binding cassette domain-containing protein [Nocardioides sp. TF02-7]|uniref:ATP-binding cassette domain-containing protein n=1 Tax=Nocardioides sp. TF02-7 TaxID=2917724 RepID=UPI0023DA6594|nr:ATP-binding cassette domain-containing protein [Nocardioides sp. TF02-7]